MVVPIKKHIGGGPSAGAPMFKSIASNNEKKFSKMMRERKRVLYI